MKIRGCIVLLSLMVVAACSTGNKTDDKKRYDSDLSFYGEEISTENIVTPADLHLQLDDSQVIETKLEATILESCKNKGCWMKVELDDGTQMRITFKDYGFFVPTEGLKGKKTIIEGVAQKKILDEATARHYAEDAGEEIVEITQPIEEYTLIANGVIITD